MKSTLWSSPMLLAALMLIHGSVPCAQESIVIQQEEVAATEVFRSPGSQPVTADAPPADSNDFEQAPAFQATQILPQSILSGANHRILPEVTADSMFFNFSVWSRWQWDYPRSQSMLYVRLLEIHALGRLEEMKQQPLFLEGLTDYVGGTVQDAAYAVTHPIDTTVKVPVGIGKFIGGIFTHPMEEQGARKGKQSWNTFTYEREKRQLAIQLGVDPYSDNQALQDALNTIASNKNFSGLLTGLTQLALPPVPHMYTFEGQYGPEVIQLVSNQSSADLQLHNRHALEKLGCSSSTIEQFLTSPAFSPTDHTVIAWNMQQLGSVGGINQYLPHLLRANTMESVIFYVRNLQLAVAYSRSVTPLTSVQMVGEFPIWQDSSGKHLCFMAIDYVFWNQRVAEGLRETFPTVPQQGAAWWITGTTTERTKLLLGQWNVTVVENVGARFWPQP